MFKDRVQDERVARNLAPVLYKMWDNGLREGSSKFKPVTPAALAQSIQGPSQGILRFYDQIQPHGYQPDSGILYADSEHKEAYKIDYTESGLAVTSYVRDLRIVERTRWGEEIRGEGAIMQMHLSVELQPRRIIQEGVDPNIPGWKLESLGSEGLARYYRSTSAIREGWISYYEPALIGHPLLDPSEAADKIVSQLKTFQAKP